MEGRWVGGAQCAALRRGARCAVVPGWPSARRCVGVASAWRCVGGDQCAALLVLCSVVRRHRGERAEARFAASVVVRARRGRRFATQSHSRAGWACLPAACRPRTGPRRRIGDELAGVGLLTDVYRPQTGPPRPTAQADDRATPRSVAHASLPRCRQTTQRAAANACAERQRGRRSPRTTQRAAANACAERQRGRHSRRTTPRTAANACAERQRQAGPYLTVSVPCMPAARCPGTEQ